MLVCLLVFVSFRDIGFDFLYLINHDVAQALVERLRLSANLEGLFSLQALEIIDLNGVEKFKARLLHDHLEILHFYHFAVLDAKHFIVFQLDQHVHILLNQAFLLLAEHHLLVDPLDY